MKKFELILPAYNESQGLPALVAQVVESALDAKFTPETFRLVLVNNGSTDSTPAVLQSLQSGHYASWLKCVDVYPNEGYGNGIFRGLQSTEAPVIAWSHADLQCAPQDAFRAYQFLTQYPEKKILVKGVRSGRKLRDILVSRIFELFARLLLGQRFHEINAQPKVFPRALFTELTDPPKTFAFDLYVLYRAKLAGYTIENIPVKFPPRIHGASKWAAHFFSRYKTIFGILAYMNTLRKNR